MWSVAFSPDGQLLASGSVDDTVRLWQVSTEQLLHTLTVHTHDVVSVAFSPDGQTLASSDWDGNICLWNPHTGRLKRTLNEHRGSVGAVAFSSDGQTLASGHGDFTIGLWNTITWQVERILTGHTLIVDCVAFSPDGDTLASGSRDKTVRLWDVDTGQLLHKLMGHTGDIRYLAFNPNGDTLASGADAADSVRLWDTETGVEKKTLTPDAGWLRPVGFSPDGRTLAIGGRGIFLWDTETSQYLPPVDVVGDILSVAFSPDGQMVGSGSADGLVRLSKFFRGVPFGNVPFDVNNIPEPVLPPKEVRDFFELDPFYQQWINVKGFPVLASERVNPYALKESAWLIWQMIGHRPEVLQALAQNRARFVVIAYTEVISDIPDYSDNRPAFYWDRRARGLGGVTCSANEENLLQYPGGDSPFSVLIHEFAHNIHTVAFAHNVHRVFNPVDSTFDSRLTSVYHAATEKGLCAGTYASVDRFEYWAEGTHAWFYPKGGDSFNNGSTRQALKTYDPALAALLTEIYGDGDWRFTSVITRTDMPHLRGFNPHNSPRFEWSADLEAAYEELRNPAINERDEWVNLPPYAPSIISNLNESRTGGGDTDILFVTLSSTEFFLYWLHPDGTETFARRAPPNDAITHFKARVGDLLLVKDATGTPLAVFQVVEKTGRALVGPTLNLITHGLSKISGDNQTSVSGTVLVNPFVVEVRDQNLSVLEGISVTFTVTTGAGTLSATRTTTDRNGRAESTLTLGPNLGTNTVLVSAAEIAQPVIFTAVAEPAVAIPDMNLRAAIETALGKMPGTPIGSVEMAALPRLDARNSNIRDLMGLEYATRLRSLELSENQILNIRPLANLKNLQVLTLDENNVRDITSLKNLTQLTWLLIGGNLISDFTPLSNLNQLEGLSLYRNQMNDPTPLGGLTKLESLWLDNNNISNITSLTGLVNLELLYLRDNEIRDMSPLVKLLMLKELRLEGNPLSYQSIHTHIPVLQNRGVTVEFGADGTRPPDVNGDGSVDVLDLIAVTSYFGHTGENIATDVSGDGVVDVLDLVLVAGMLQATAAAPSPQAQAPETLTAVEVRGWLTDARALEGRDPIIKRGMMVLEQLLASLTPKETELLANYPNPFNPETWIPYRLAEDAFVTLTIYDLSGQVVRTLNVGHRIASAYEGRSKAIYWNGKNNVGEQVASGVYFYHLHAGGYSKAQKMIILK